MKKVTKMVLMLCLILLGALCYAHGVARTETEKKGDGIPISVKEKVAHGDLDKSSYIHATIDGHLLTVFFTQNIGPVDIEVTTASGALVQTMCIFTPDGWQTYLIQTGDYVITFYLSNGDEYYGEFTVTD